MAFLHSSYLTTQMVRSSIVDAFADIFVTAGFRKSICGSPTLFGKQRPTNDLC